MGKRIRYGKKDNEKKKQQERQEKQKRKEERAKSATRSFDDMIAYVDENGMLHSTPPVKSKEEIDIETIAISTPKQEEVEDQPLTGRVEYFNADKGYGFIKDSASVEKYFFHISAAPANIAVGNKVTFETERGTRGMSAVQISII